QGLTHLSYSEREVLAQLRLPAGADSEGYELHPSMLDAALQAAVGLSISQDIQKQPGTFVPYAVQAVAVYGRVPHNAWAYVQYSAGSEPAGSKLKYDIVLTDANGAICVSLKGLAVRSIVQPVDNGLFYSTPEWQVKPLADGDKVSPIEPGSNTLLLVGLEPDVVETITATFDSAEVIAFPQPGPDIAGYMRHLVGQSQAQLKGLIPSKASGPGHQVLVVARDTVARYIYAPLAGLLKTARLEQPHLRGKVITVSNPEIDGLMSILSQELRSDSFQAMEIRYDASGVRTAKTLREVALPAPAKRGYLKPGGVYWIIGGLGGLGRIFARHLLEQGDHVTLILSGRSALDEVAKQHLADLKRDGGTVAYLSADVGQWADVERVVRTIREKYGSLNGIIHSAGVIRDSLIFNKTAVEIEAVLAPKVSGMLNIDAVTQAEPLDFVVLFSSMAGVLGNIGQADYAAANAFLDSFAQHRQSLVEQGQRSGRTLSINWPLWADGGMTVDDET
ncbi:MAG: SDR family NAD(P)-dependent oxidoreductase, partial [Anaerolineae bacterium]|nr:SDR family NAD(P)-dependent oxidoreductase [Anaerolineae bacterium]